METVGTAVLLTSQQQIEVKSRLIEGEGQSGVHPMVGGAQSDRRPCSMANSVAPARVVTPALA
jgi:hypothetical protein